MKQSGIGQKRRVLVVTGSRAEFGLLRPVMKAVLDREELELLVVAAGSHLVQPAVTFREVKAEFAVADSVPMQVVGKVGRREDVEAVGRGIARFGRSFSMLEPDWVVVLGDRIEAFAAASAASIGGWALAHIHGGDRAEGVADEAMRHAITKLANIHFPATAGSGERILKMGEPEDRVFVVGSPAVDGLKAIPEMSDEDFGELGWPEVVVLMHPCGRGDEYEGEEMRKVLSGVGGKRVLVLMPNLDAGRRGIVGAIEEFVEITKTQDPHPGPLLKGEGGKMVVRDHLVRDEFVGLLKRIGRSGGGLVGNSSSGLIECSVIGCPSVDVGIRQAGRERCSGWTVHVDDGNGVEAAINEITARPDRGNEHPYGNGTAGVAIAQVLAEVDPLVEGFVRKRCVY